MKEYFNIRYEFDREAVHNAIKSRLAEDKPGYIAVASGTIVTQAKRNLAYRDAISRSMFAICDSSYVPLYIKWIYGKRYEQYSGSQIFERIIKEGKYRMAFLGTDDATLQSLKQNLKKLNAGVERMLFWELPFCKVEEFDYNAIAERLKSDGAEIVWVALGAPKQELFMDYLQRYLNHGVVMLGVGAAFKFFGDESCKRAPEWMVKNHLEFAYRILKEPKKQLSRCWDDIITLPGLLMDEFARKRNKGNGK